MSPAIPTILLAYVRIILVLRAVVSRVAREHSEHLRQRIANFKALRRRPSVRGAPVPRDIRCHTQTPAALGPNATAHRQHLRSPLR